MDHTWFPRSRESGSLLRCDDARPNDNSSERASPLRDKTWATVVECGLFACMILIVAISGIW
jgi:hypothetical protein